MLKLKLTLQQLVVLEEIGKVMKNIIRIWVIVSLLFIAFLLLKIVDYNVSIKYEVEDARFFNSGGNELIDNKEESLENKITFVYVVISMLIINIYYSVKYLRKDKDW